MPTAEARIATDRASRYLVQLCRHADMMVRMRHRPPARHGGRQMPDVRHVEWSDTHGTVRFAEGQWTLDASSDALTVHVEADDEETLQRLQNGITGRIEKIGRRDGLKVTWQERPPSPSAAPTDETPYAAGAPKGDGRTLRSFTKTTGLLMVGALVIAVHLGVAGATLTASTWTGWAVNGILALIALKVAIVAGHVILGRLGIRRGKAFLTHHRQRHTPPEPEATNPSEAALAQTGLMTSEERA
ncbi:DUF2218 domain-containing protein [Streptomyces sp. NPDC001634]|uniref:DUF2218 domain-containing protein n=1 Tax=Streptomyces sp. NPDC001634 TaxID=3154390 RepID=UPI00331C922A